jgi:serine protease Do
MDLARPQGVLLKSIFPGGPAAQAGLKTGDVILQIDGVEVDDMQGLNYRIATHRPGDVVKARVASGRQTREVSLAVSLPPENPPRQLTTISGRNPLTGAKVENLSPAVAADLQLDFSARGVVIVSTSGSTPSGSYGFQPGDIVRSINGAEIHSVGELERALASAGGHWDMVVDRGDQRLTLSVGG